MAYAKITLLLCAGLFSLSALAAPESDDWSGHYRSTWISVSPMQHGNKPPDEEFWIVRAADADPAKLGNDEGRKLLPKEKDREPGTDLVKLAKERGIDLTRWAISPDGKSDGKKAGVLRRFLPQEYKGFGWDSLHEAGGIECLHSVDAFFFVCRVEPGTTITTGEASQEKLLARTGFFGAVIDVGGFELTKLDSAP
ncbi:MAG: hypothetical protein LBE24_03005 [Methylobacillus sp.]|jgi:hypothetical protein|nr:hypothetical protein [Methylobacillus sp.]